MAASREQLSSMPMIQSRYSDFITKDGDVLDHRSRLGSAVDISLHPQRWTSIAGMVGFRNTIHRVALMNPTSQSSQPITFCLGMLRFSFYNHMDSESPAAFLALLPSGLSCDEMGAPASEHKSPITSEPFIVPVKLRANDDKVVAKMDSDEGIVIVHFEQTVMTTPGETVFVVGSIPQLGNWCTEDAISLSSPSYPLWTTCVAITANTTCQYKFIRRTSDGTIAWESGPNRSFRTPSSGSQTVSTSWK